MSRHTGAVLDHACPRGGRQGPQRRARPGGAADARAPPGQWNDGPAGGRVAPAGPVDGTGDVKKERSLGGCAEALHRHRAAGRGFPEYRASSASGPGARNENVSAGRQTTQKPPSSGERCARTAHTRPLKGASATTLLRAVGSTTMPGHEQCSLGVSALRSASRRRSVASDPLSATTGPSRSMSSTSSASPCPLGSVVVSGCAALVHVVGREV